MVCLFVERVYSYGKDNFVLLEITRKDYIFGRYIFHIGERESYDDIQLLKVKKKNTLLNKNGGLEIKTNNVILKLYTSRSDEFEKKKKLFSEEYIRRIKKEAVN